MDDRNPICLSRRGSKLEWTVTYQLAYQWPRPLVFLCLSFGSVSDSCFFSLSLFFPFFYFFFFFFLIQIKKETKERKFQRGKQKKSILMYNGFWTVFKVFHKSLFFHGTLGISIFGNVIMPGDGFCFYSKSILVFGVLFACLFVFLLKWGQVWRTYLGWFRALQSQK